MKKKGEKIQTPGAAKAPVEPWWKELKDVYFSFHKKHFKDADGYPLSPDWNPQKIGMEAGALKKIIIFLREIAEGKNIEWSLEYATERLIDFLQRAYADQWIRKNFYCAMLNKKKIDILCKAFNPALIKRILEIWYFDFPNYVVDHEKDKIAAEIIIGFLKQQYLLASVQFTEESMLGTFRKISLTVKDDEFWCKKTLRSVANNLQEFINRIKANKNGTRKQVGRNDFTGSIEGFNTTPKPKGSFGEL